MQNTHCVLFIIFKFHPLNLKQLAFIPVILQLVKAVDKSSMFWHIFEILN